MTNDFDLDIIVAGPIWKACWITNSLSRMSRRRSLSWVTIISEIWWERWSFHPLSCICECLAPMAHTRGRLPHAFCQKLRRNSYGRYYSLDYVDRGSLENTSRAFVNWALNYKQNDVKKLKLVTLCQSTLETLSQICLRCTHIHTQLCFPMTDREFMLIFLQNLDDFFKVIWLLSSTLPSSTWNKSKGTL